MLAKRWIARFLETNFTQLGAFAATYGLGVSLYLLLHFAVGEDWPLIASLNNAAQLLTLFCIPALLIALCIPCYRVIWSLYALPGCLAFLVWYGPFFLPKPHVLVGENDIVLTVATYNTSGIINLVSDIITSNFNDADFIAFQELNPVAEHVAIAISRSPNIVAQNNRNAIYTPHTLVEGNVRLIGGSEDQRFGVDGIRVLFDVNGVIIAVYNIHPAPALRYAQWVTMRQSGI